MEKIIYGGSFNPPTIGHYDIASFLLNKFSDASLILLPTNSFYNKPGLATYKERFEMVQLMKNELENKNEFKGRVEVSDLEARDPKFMGTYNTLKELNHPAFVIGADSLDTLSNWINGFNLIKENTFIVFPRVGYDIASILSRDHYKEYKSHFLVMDDFSNVEVSSTLYRETKDDSILLSDVKEYIKRNHLYEN